MRRFPCALLLAAALAAAPAASSPPPGGASAYRRLPDPGAGERLLIVAPHVDDEAIAAAGYARAVVARGGEVFVVYLTAGDCNRFAAALIGRASSSTGRPLLREGRARIAEAVRAMAALGVPAGHLFVLGYPDRGLARLLARPDARISSPCTRQTEVPYTQAVSPGAPYRLASLERDLLRVVREAAPTTIVAPVAFDRHSDHAAAAVLVDRLMRELPEPPRRLGYLVHHAGYPSPLSYSPRRQLLPPARRAGNAGMAGTWRLFPLDPATEALKKRVLHKYRSQIRDPYLWLLLDAFVRKNELFLEAPAPAAPLTGRASDTTP